MKTCNKSDFLESNLKTGPPGVFFPFRSEMEQRWGKVLILNLEWKMWDRITLPSHGTKITGSKPERPGQPKHEPCSKSQTCFCFGVFGSKPLLSLMMAEVTNTGAWYNCADVKEKQPLTICSVPGRAGSSRLLWLLDVQALESMISPNRGALSQPQSRSEVPCSLLSPNSLIRTLGARENRETGKGGEGAGVVGI